MFQGELIPLERDVEDERNCSYESRNATFSLRHTDFDESLCEHLLNAYYVDRPSVNTWDISVTIGVFCFLFL